MKTRKPKTPVKRRAPHAPVARRAAKGRPTAARKATRRTGPPARRAVEIGEADAGASEVSLMLAAECTVAEADSLKSDLVRLLADSRTATLDVSAVQRIDTAGLQLLAAFVRDRRTSGRQMRWRGRAPALQAAADLLGLRGMLELPGEDGR